MAQNAVAFADNDVATIAWSYGRKPEGCMGFAIYRIDDKGREEALPSHAVFKGMKITSKQRTDQFPIQKFYWKDVYARLVAEKTGNRKFRYKVVPLEKVDPLRGGEGNLRPMTTLPFVVSNEVEVSSNTSPGVSAYFNRGLISTQRVSRFFKGNPNAVTLRELIADPANKLRESLSGDMVEALTGFLARAATSGHVYAALYELGDEELIAGLVKLKKRLHIVLSNSVTEVTENGKKTKVDGNQGARDRLAKAGVRWDRIMPTNHIGHNKFLVYVDKDQKAQAVLLGSTNWTSTGLCAQTNNTMIVDDPKLARRYLAYWRKLAADTKAAAGVPKALQGTVLRTWDAKGQTIKLASGTVVASWCSPCTPKARSSGAKNELRPPDMAAVVERIDRAKHAILFLAFYPGTPSIANWTAAALRRAKSEKRDLFVRGCVTNKSAAEGFYYELKGTTPPKKVKGDKSPVKQDPRVIGAEAFDGKDVPIGWQKEILKAGFAIIHDKILVIDPFSDDCVVVTGSHNLGHKASYDNDENLVIVEGDRNLAVAYATHVLDVYDHFAWRYRVKEEKKGANTEQFLKDTPDEWLERYFDAEGNVHNAQLKFWMDATVHSPA